MAVPEVDPPPYLVTWVHPDGQHSAVLPICDPRPWMAARHYSRLVGRICAGVVEVRDMTGHLVALFQADAACRLTRLPLPRKPGR